MEVYKIPLSLSFKGEYFRRRGGVEEPTLEIRAEYKLVSTLPYVEEKHRVCEVNAQRAEGL